MSEQNLPEVAAQVVERAEPLIRSLPPEKQTQLRQLITTSIQYQGPLPPPEMLEAYGRIIPNGAERLLVLLENQTAHRISIEDKLVTAKISSTKLGQYIAAGLSVFFGLIAAFLGYHGHEVLAGSIGVTTIIGLAVVFVLGKEPGQRATPTDNNRQSKPQPRAPGKKKGG